MTIEADTTSAIGDLRAIIADEAAFRRWYDQTLPAVYGYLASRCLGDEDLARELAQETYVAAIHARSRFDGRSEPTTWLCGIARHKLADHFRRAEREEQRRLRATVRALDVDAERATWQRAEERVAISAALRGLPAGQRAVLTFVALDDLPVADVARLVGKSFGATQSLLARARESFRRAYGQEIDR